MKNYFKVSILLIVATAYFAIESCQKETQFEKRKVNTFFKDVKIIPTIGIVHNELAQEFLTKNKDIINNKSFEEKNNLIVSFFEEKGYYDVEDYFLPYLPFKTSKGDKSGYDFSPYEFVDNQKENVSDYFYSKIYTLLSDVEYAGNDTTTIFEIINTYKESVLTDENFYINENEQFVIPI